MTTMTIAESREREATLERARRTVYGVHMARAREAKEVITMTPERKSKGGGDSGKGKKGNGL